MLTPVLEMLGMAAVKPFEQPPPDLPHSLSSHMCLRDHGVSSTQPCAVFPPHTYRTDGLGSVLGSATTGSCEHRGCHQANRQQETRKQEER